MDSGLIRSLDDKDLEAARAFIEEEDDPARVLAMYHGAIRHLYWSCKDIASVAALGTQALGYGAELDDERHLGLVKSIAYDIGSFCWPGWDEPGIDIDDDVRHIGSEAAGINLGLAEILDRPDVAKSAAHWLVGAHLLATGERAGAARIFEVAASYAKDARPLQLLYEGYAAIARGEPLVTEELATLEDGPDLVSQLETAHRVLGRTIED